MKWYVLLVPIEVFKEIGLEDKATHRIKEVKDLKGESSVSIRKSKKIVTYDYSTKLVWECSMAEGKNHAMGIGYLKQSS